MDADDRAVYARGLELHTRRGPVFRPTTLQVPTGAVAALLGPARSGRTALLLTLAGRMRESGGSATVLGYDLATHRSQVRAAVGLGLIAGVNDLDGALTAGQHLSERALYARGSARDTRSLLARVGLADARDSLARDLDTEECVRLGIALALVGAPRIVVLDDLDHDLELGQQAAIVELLGGLARERGLTVLFTCVDERTAALADVTVVLPAYSAVEEVCADEVA